MTESPPPRPWYVRHWALLALVILLAGQHVIFRWSVNKDREWVALQTPKWLPFLTSPTQLENVNVTKGGNSLPADDLWAWREGKIFEALDQPSWMAWHEMRSEAIQFVQMKMKALAPCNWHNTYLQFVSVNDEDQDFDGDFLRERTARPLVRMVGDELTLEWHLLRPVHRLRLLLPSGARFRILDAMYYPMVGRYDTRYIHFLLTSINIGLCASWLAGFVPTLARTISRPPFIGCSIVALHGILMVWLLPPFQGPDENRHWKAALTMFRGNADPVLNELPNLLNAEAPRWRCEVPFSAQTLRGSASRDVPPGEQTSVGYAGPWAYPVVGFVSLFFPRVQTLNDALIFYYCCRLVPLAVLLLLLAALWRRGLASWTLVTFLSLPLVMQQMLVVSTDTVPNLGTLAALLLFAQPRGRCTLLALTLVCVLVVLAKPPIYAVLLVLPAWYLPWARMLRWQVLVPLSLAGVALVVGGYFALWSVVNRTDDALASHAQKQLQLLLTTEGLQKFGLGLLEYPTRFLNPHYWWAPLGWLDTPLSDLHKNLLWVSLLVAIAVDLARGGLRVVRQWKPALKGLALAVVHGLFTWISLGSVMYLTITEHGVAYINGMQVRYMIPVVLFALVLPVILMKHAEPEPPPNPPRPWWVVVHRTLLALAVVRAIQLAGDLQYRYWG